MHTLDGSLDDEAMIEMYMSEDTVVGFVAMGKVLAVLLNTLVVVFLVPILNLLDLYYHSCR